MEWLAYCVVLSSRPDARALLVRLGCDEAGVAECDDPEVLDEFIDEGMQQHDEWSAAWSGVVKGWAYCVVPFSGSPLIPERLQRASEDCTVVSFANMNPLCQFEYWDRGRRVTGFEMMSPHRREGDDLDRLLEEMRRAGCFEDGLQWDDRGRALLGEVTGVEIPRPLTDGPVLTGRMPALYGGPEGPSPYGAR